MIPLWLSLYALRIRSETFCRVDFLFFNHLTSESCVAGLQYLQALSSIADILGVTNKPIKCDTLGSAVTYGRT